MVTKQKVAVYFIKQNAKHLDYQKLGVDNRERGLLSMAYSFICSECLLLLSVRHKLPDWMNLSSGSVQREPKSWR